MNKKELLIVGAVLVLLVASVAAWMYQGRTSNGLFGSNDNNGSISPDSDGDAVMCAQDTMQCANGDYVARTPPDCRFVCPDVSATPIVADTSGTLVVRIGESGKPSSKSTVEINPMGILEDSRCPVDVQCIQAGTVRVRATVLSGTVSSTADFKLGEPLNVGGETITLVEVAPVKDTRKPITYSDYRFTFKIK